MQFDPFAACRMSTDVLHVTFFNDEQVTSKQQKKNNNKNVCVWCTYLYIKGTLLVVNSGNDLYTMYTYFPAENRSKGGVALLQLN